MPCAFLFERVTRAEHTKREAPRTRRGARQARCRQRRLTQRHVVIACRQRHPLDALALHHDRDRVAARAGARARGRIARRRLAAATSQRCLFQSLTVYLLHFLFPFCGLNKLLPTAQLTENLRQYLTTLRQRLLPRTNLRAIRVSVRRLNVGTWEKG